MTYCLLCYKNNSSIIVDWIWKKDGLKYKMQAIVHIMTYFLLCYKGNSACNYCWLNLRKDRLKYKM